MVASRRTYILNSLINKYKYEYYLEIGIGHANKNFNKINCVYKTGVDPNVKCDYQMSSYKFFKKTSGNKKYDIIYIDGDHSYKQVLKDVNNSLKNLSVDGTLALHDCSPISEEIQGTDNTVWKAFAELRMTRKDLYMYTVDIKHGIGIIRRGRQELFPGIPIKKLTYKFLERNRKELLNLYSVEEFLKKIKKD